MTLTGYRCERWWAANDVVRKLAKSALLEAAPDSDPIRVSQERLSEIDSTSRYSRSPPSDASGFDRLGERLSEEFGISPSRPHGTWPLCCKAQVLTRVPEPAKNRRPGASGDTGDTQG